MNVSITVRFSMITILSGCVVFEAPVDRDASQPGADAGRADGGASADAGDVSDAGVDGALDAGHDAGSDAGPPSCVVPSITSVDDCTGDIVVNEVDGSGAGMADYVEIYNRGTAPVNVSGWIIADGTAAAPDVAEGIPIPDGTVLDPGRFIWLWANLEAESMMGWQTTNCQPGAPQPCLNSPWGISASGEYIYVLDDELTIVCTFQYPVGIFADEAFGRVGDGTTTLCPTDPSPGEPNVRSSNPAR